MTNALSAMGTLRNTLTLFVVAAVAVAAVLGKMVLGGSVARLLVDAGLAVSLVLIVQVLMSPTVARVNNLVEALRALARGERHQRVTPEDFAGLAEVARAVNEVAASLTEHDDPNLGPVKSQPRPRPAGINVENRPKLEATPPDSEHPEVGQVRVRRKDAPKQDSTPPTAADGNGRPAMAAPTNDTSIDEAPRSDVKSDVGAPPTLPTRDELEQLFQEFVAAKKLHDESVADLDFDAFASTINGECERLVAAHQCKGVRFEVTIQDGEVSLRPRLLR